MTARLLRTSTRDRLPCVSQAAADGGGGIRLWRRDQAAGSVRGDAPRGGVVESSSRGAPKRRRWWALPLLQDEGGGARRDGGGCCRRRPSSAGPYTTTKKKISDTILVAPPQDMRRRASARHLSAAAPCLCACVSKGAHQSVRGESQLRLSTPP